MHKFLQIPGTRRKHFLGATGLATLAILILAGIIGAAATPAQSPSQDKSAHKPALEYDVVSIKVFKRGQGPPPSSAPGISETPDGLVGRRVNVKRLIQKAYGVEDYQISGAADWISSELYDIDAKFDTTTADELQKLNLSDRIPARQQMLQALLADRFNLTIHPETKELQIYALVVAKNGPKLQEVKLGGAEPDKPKPGPAPGTASMVVGGTAGGQMRAFASPLSNLTLMLTSQLHRPVLDRTGLTGKYDFTLRWTPDENPTQPSSSFQGPPGASPSGLPSADPNQNAGPTLFTAIQEQLGLKLESAKGPIEFIVIDHIERPSGN